MAEHDTGIMQFSPIMAVMLLSHDFVRPNGNSQQSCIERHDARLRDIEV